MKKYASILLLFALATFLGVAGCAATINVAIDSISDKGVAAKTNYVLFPGTKDIGEDDLQYREYARYVERVLASLGYNKAVNIADADIAIFFSYGIGDPVTKQFTSTVPTWGQINGSSHTSGTINTYGDTAIYSETTTYTPDFGITGSAVEITSYTIYRRHMVLDAIDLEEYRTTQKLKQVWKTSATSSGASGDLRRVLPALVAAAKPYIGKDTGKRVKVALSEDDEEILEIKGLTE